MSRKTLALYMLLICSCQYENAPTGPAPGNGVSDKATRQQPKQVSPLSPEPVDEVAVLAEVKQQTAAADISVLFIGNSHSQSIAGTLTRIFARNQPDSPTYIRRAGISGYLADHLAAGSTSRLIQAGKWNYVVLQGQKYSTSGKYEYPHEAAIELARLAKLAGAQVIMFPEWARRDVPGEYARVRHLHELIADKTSATVAPIGEAWEAALNENETLDLYAPDGNHASSLGHYLNACIFYGIITGLPAGSASLPVEPESEFHKRQLEQVSSEVVARLADLK